MVIIDKHADTRQIIRAVVYIRFSSKQQTESYSIEYQQEECLKHIERKGYKFVGEYIDAAKTGKSTAGREALEEMLYDAGRNKFDRIIVFSFSRSFRNTRDALNTNHELMEKHGIAIESVIEPIDLTTAHGKFSGTNLFAMHELQSDIIAAHVRSGMYVAAKQGYYLGGTVSYGYSTYETGEYTRGKARKKYCINENEAEVVKLIFKMYADGFSILYIRDELQKRDIRSKLNDGFISPQTLSRMLHNEFYIGTREFNIKGYEPLHIENAVPAIIDIETWNAVQDRLKNIENKPKPRKTKRFYALTGKLVCAHCGGHYCGKHYNGRNKSGNGHSVYVCYKKRNHGLCKAINVNKDVIEQYCIDQIKKHILTPEKIKEIAAYIVSQTDGTPELIKEEFEAAEKRKRKVLEIIKKMKRDLYEMDEAEAEAQEELIADYSKELNALNEKIARLDTIEQSVISEQTVFDLLNDCALKIDSSDPQILKSVFDKLIEKVVIYDDKVELYLIVFPFAYAAHKNTDACPQYNLCTAKKRSEF